MLYPKVLNIEKGKKMKGILLLISVLVSILLVVINVLVDYQNKWSLLCIVGILYVWLTTLYSLKRNVNIASHVMIQMLCISALTVAIDYILGYKGWSITLAIPIMIIIGNLTLLVLTIVSRKRYIKYAVYQIIIFLLSMIPFILMFKHIQNYYLPTIISSSIAVFTLLITLILCGKDLYKDMIRRFHI